MKKSAFTLIELLVVIAIIALLAAIALPVFNKAQEKGRATACLANLRQVGTGIYTYLGDNDDQMFSLTGAAGGGGAPPTWPVTLHSKYVPNWKVFRSPFDRLTRTRPDTEKEPVPVSYGINTNAFDTNLSKYVSASQFILGAPAMLPGKEVLFAGTSQTNVVLEMPTGAANKQGTHSGRGQINVLFADAHVSNMGWADFATTATEDGLKRWYPEGKPSTP
jgi:prepilin-type N-terminal cleavage/methylation domain-containing protein/prepilin-type processing-associated H-X9-DG protein